MSNVFIVTNDCEHDLLDLIEKYLKELPLDDSNQTKFELGSNNLEFGVLAYNETVALVLLTFLRIIIDDMINLLTKDSFHSFVEEFDPKDN